MLANRQKESMAGSHANKENIDNESIEDMIHLLQEY